MAPFFEFLFILNEKRHNIKWHKYKKVKPTRLAVLEKVCVKSWVDINGLHADIVAAAKSKGESLNQFVAETLEQAVHA